MNKIMIDRFSMKVLFKHIAKVKHSLTVPPKMGDENFISKILSES